MSAQEEFDALMAIHPRTGRDYELTPNEALENYINRAVHEGVISLKESAYFKSQYKLGNITADFLDRKLF